MANLNPRLAKKHLSYTVEEIADLYHVHKNTVRQWIRQGLPVCNEQRPLLILGPVLREFLHARREKNKRPCQPGEIYCVRCHAPKKPAGDIAEYQPKTASLGNLVAICPNCYTLMNQRVSLAKLTQIQAHLDITFPQAPRHIVESNSPTVNSDLKKGAKP